MYIKILPYSLVYFNTQASAQFAKTQLITSAATTATTMEPLKNWDVFMMADIYMNRMFPSGAVSKHLKNSAYVVVSRFVCLYDEPICNVSTSTSKMYRFQSNDIPGNQTR